MAIDFFDGPSAEIGGNCLTSLCIFGIAVVIIHWFRLDLLLLSVFVFVMLLLLLLLWWKLMLY